MRVELLRRIFFVGVGLSACHGPPAVEVRSPADLERAAADSMDSAQALDVPAALPVPAPSPGFTFRLPSGAQACAVARPDFAELVLQVDAPSVQRVEEMAWLKSWLLAALGGPPLQELDCSRLLCLAVPRTHADAALLQLKSALEQVSLLSVDMAREKARVELRRWEALESFNDTWNVAKLVAAAPLKRPEPWGSAYLSGLPREKALRLLGQLELELLGPIDPGKAALRYGTTPSSSSLPALQKAGVGEPSPWQSPTADDRHKLKLFWLDVDLGDFAQAWISWERPLASPALDAALAVAAHRLAAGARQAGVQMQQQASGLQLRANASALMAFLPRVHAELDRLIQDEGAPTANELRLVQPRHACSVAAMHPEETRAAVASTQRRTVLMGLLEVLAPAVGESETLVAVDPRNHRLGPAPAPRPKPATPEETFRF